MSLQDALNIFLIIGLTIFIICISITTYFSVRAFKAITDLAEDIKGKTNLKSLIAIPGLFLTLVSKFLRKGR
ncbi:hypothetical protein A3C59_01990 [Candidatus Daviesbacteria bacterium RIFCSPHIGHO2_02_FULL_36_13]|uniref:Uncharacterized protein n=1 Tax=Candidatus Daviesbacteria bacterium RIFCSPHIGHO2_02_FULL_36_13 TaxID=1797768 RepID=A0A1F5JYW8_9BACT|nr:MAG: hypothetical protein A3C59_01990 [Candidatus Daviesbacteria bacterium RIFCSPHIGHO2_02_FULL_36_13]